MPTGIDLILADHERVNGLFDEFDKTGDATIIGEVLGALTAHDEAEHSALYPLARALLSDDELIARSSLAHSAVKKQMDLIRQLEGPPLVDAFSTLRELVTAHATDEEKNLLPALAKAATPAQLDGLAARIEHTKQRVG